MLSIPIIAGALMRFPLVIFSQYTDRQRAALVGLARQAVEVGQRRVKGGARLRHVAGAGAALF